MAAMVPSTVDTVDVTNPRITLLRVAFRSSVASHRAEYHLSVSPLSGKTISTESLKEKTTRSTMGRYRKSTSSQKYRNPECPITARRI